MPNEYPLPCLVGFWIDIGYHEPLRPFVIKLYIFDAAVYFSWCLDFRDNGRK